MTNWTTAQQNAISDRGRSLVVSAGAGSGKTSVLTQRILQKVLQGEDINRFLVVTFTNAAASDLREKLYAGLNKSLAENPKNKHLYRQMFAIESAYISTIHSFCLENLRQNFQALGLPPKMRIADESEAQILLENCVEKLFDSLYEKEDRGFLMLIKQLTNQKSDNPLKKDLIEIYHKIRAYPNPEKWFLDIEQKLFSEREKSKSEPFDTECFEVLKEITSERISDAFVLLDEAENLYGGLNDKQIRIFEETKLLLEDIKEGLNKGYDEISSIVYRITPLRYMRDKSAVYSEEGSELKTEIWTLINKIRDDFFIKQDQIYADFATTFRFNQELSRLVLALDKEYSNTKLERKVFDYADLEHLMVKLLTDDESEDGKSDVCRKISAQFDEVYIDEYQDTSPIQDRIFSLISSDDNKFIVGDIKQSLYRFRNAEPEIFLRRVENAEDFDSDSTRARIYLRENFRCDGPIIDFTNEVFRKSYNNKYGEYGENEKLVFGKNPKEKENKVTVTEITGTAEEEAAYVAEEIIRCKEKLRKDDGEELSYSDFAILLRSPKTGAEPFLKALQERGIPVYSEQSGSFLNAPEILLAVSLLKTVDNPRDDISLASLLRSPIFNFTDDELAEIRLASSEGSMFDSLKDCVRRYRARSFEGRFLCFPLIANSKVAYKKRTYMPMPRVRQTTAEKIDVFLKRLSLWQRKSEGSPSYKFIWYIYGSTGLYSLVSDEKSGDIMQRNLLMLYEYARMFEKTMFRGLGSFITYLNEIYSSERTLSEASSSLQNNDCVKIMSIHKSKGLQFEVCFLSNAGKRMGGASRERYIIRRESGIFFKKRIVRGVYVRDSFIAKLWGEREKKDNLGEEMRGLYVALTRAKQKLFVTGVKTPYKESQSYMSVIKSSVFKTQNEVEYAEFVEYIDGYEVEEKEEVSKEEEKKIFTNDEEILKRLDFVYPHTSVHISNVPVSRLIQGEIMPFAISPEITQSPTKPSFIEQKDDGAEKGTAMHMFIQFANFDSVEKIGLEAEALRLCEIQMITKEQSELLDFRQLSRFFSSNLYKRIKDSPNVMREKRFSITEESGILGIQYGEHIQVQGVIDLFFEEQGEFVIVDFKTDRISNRTSQDFVERHTPQLSYYSRALERMTGKKVKEALLYSFTLGREMQVDKDLILQNL